MDSNLVLILVLGTALLAYYMGMRSCGRQRVLYRWLPRTLEDEPDSNALKVLREMSGSPAELSEEINLGQGRAATEPPVIPQ